MNTNECVEGGACRPPLTAPPTTKGTTMETVPKFNGTDCGPAYGGGYNPACLAPPATVTTSIGTAVHTAPPVELPFTGADLTGLAVVGSLLFAAGAAIVRNGRRRSV